MGNLSVVRLTEGMTAQPWVRYLRKKNRFNN
jgi:hypothetical protein